MKRKEKEKLWGIHAGNNKKQERGRVSSSK